ncbi:MAG TPA: nucleoside-diphosphate kinase [Candidatus Eremiobacteraceae bacterium]|nr:nucleoside-diphosphate kinase [Candidatus Eremiobacteraceae bacterium]
MERTLIFAKPDAVQRGLVGELIGRFERRGLQLAGLKLMRVTAKIAQEHYKEHVGKPFFQGLVDYITSCPVVALVVQGPNAVEIVRTTIGATNPVAAAPGSIRGDLGISIGRNLVHGSDSVASAEREIKLFFADSELFSYPRSIDQWILEQ